MDKNKTPKPQRFYSKRQRSHWEKQKLLQRIILITGIVVVLAALLVVGTGWYINEYQPLHQVVIKANDTGFTMESYINMLAYYSIYYYGLEADYVPYVANQVVSNMEDNELIRQAADKLGITVSDDEIKTEMSKSKTKIDARYSEAIRSQLLVQKLLDKYFDPQVPQSAEQRHVMSIFLETEQQAKDVVARLQKGEDFGTLASTLSVDSTTKSKKGDLGTVPQGVLASTLGSSIVDDIAFGKSVVVDAVSQPIADPDHTKSVGYWIIKVLDRPDDKTAHVLQILAGTQDNANKVKSRLDAGEDFSTVAKEVTLDSNTRESGGDTTLTLESLSAPLKDYVSKAELNKNSAPIRDEGTTTNGGYWIVKVTGIESNKKIEGDNRTVLKNKLANDWMSQVSSDTSNKRENLLTEEQQTFAITKVQALYK